MEWVLNSRGNCHKEFNFWKEACLKEGIMMIKRISAINIALTLAVMIVVPAGAGAGAKIPAPKGPYPVGARLEHIPYQGREMAIIVWYPARAEAGAKAYPYIGKVQGQALADAPLDDKGAPYPLILFSHGMGGCGTQSIFYTENLASFGYVVVAPDHEDSAMCHLDREPDITPGQIAWAAVKSGGNLSGSVFALFGDRFKETGFDFSYRPDEAKAAIDQALHWNGDQSSFLYSKIAPDRIGVTGHSLGGFTSLMVGGVPFFCDQPEDQNPEGCDFEKLDLDRIPNPCCLDYVRNSNPYQSRDPRVKAILPLGPAAFFPHLDRAAAEIKIPVMIITGDNKSMEVPWDPIWTFYEHAPAPKYVLRLKKTDHMTIADMTLNVSAAGWVLPGFRSHFAEKAQAYQDYSVAFFNKYLKGDNSGEAVLTKPENKFVELWHQEP